MKKNEDFKPGDIIQIKKRLPKGEFTKSSYEAIKDSGFVGEVMFGPLALYKKVDGKTPPKGYKNEYDSFKVRFGTRIVGIFRHEIKGRHSE